MINDNNLKIFRVLFSRSTDQLKKFVPVIVDDMIFEKAFNTLFDVLEPAYKTKLIKNYRIQCNKLINPDIQDDHILHARISFQFDNEEWISINYDVNEDFRINVFYKESPKAEFVPVTFCIIDKDGNVGETND